MSRELAGGRNGARRGRQPLKKLEPDPERCQVLERWRAEAAKAGRTIDRIALAFEAGRDGFWLARWLRARGIEAHVIHSTSVAVSREHRRAKTDRLDTAMLMRVFLGWLRGERGHCRMVAIPTLEEEDAKRPSRERENLVGETHADHQPHEVERWPGSASAASSRSCARRRERLAALRTPEELPLPPNTLAEMRRDMARLAWSASRSRRSSRPGSRALEQAPATGRHAMVRSWPASSASASRRPTCWFRRCCRATCGTAGRWRAMPA